MMLWKRLCLLLLAVVVVIALGTVSAFAQDEETVFFENVRLWLYPEYDDSRLLVMLEGEVVGVVIPFTIRFLVPESAVMYSAGSRDEFGIYAGGPPNRTPSDVPGWDEISYSMTSNTFRVEYYGGEILGDPDRSIDYQFRTLYPIADLKVYAQEPMESRDYTVTGLGESSPVDYDGFDNRFAVHVFTYQNLGVADVLDFQIAYARSTNEPSLPPPSDVLAAAGESSSAADGDGGSTGVAVAVAATLLIVLGGGAFWVYRARSGRRNVARRPVAAGRRRPVKRQSEAARQAGAKARAGHFCTSCGERLSSADRFCSACGARIE